MGTSAAPVERSGSKAQASVDQASSNRNGSQKVVVGDMPAEVLLNIFRHLGSCVTANSKAFLPKHFSTSTVSNALTELTQTLSGANSHKRSHRAHTAAPSPLLLASQVCKQWRALIYGVSIEYVVAQGVTLSLPTCSLPLYSSLQSIRLDSCMFSTDLKHLCNKEENEENTPFQDDSAFLFSPRQGSFLSEAFPFSSFKHLSSVQLSGCPNLSGATFKSLCLCSKLQSLTLSAIHSLVNSDLQGLRNLPHLHSLDISKCQHLTSSALPHIQSVPHLKNLKFDGLAVDRDLGPISDIRDLENLDILNAPTLSDIHLPALATLSTLTRLSLASSHELSSTALTCLKPLTQLQQLSLARCRLLAGAAAECVTSMRALTALSFSGCCFLDADALGHVARGATALHTLDISGCIALAGPALNQLVPMACLERLSLARCFFMDSEGIRHVSCLPKLRHLDIARCDRLSPQHCGPLQHAAALEQLNVGDVAPMGGFCIEDWPKLSHVRVTRLPFMLEEL